jgi:hypothetical protein
LVRPYALTRGRTQPRGLTVDLVSVVIATGRAPGDGIRLSMEHRRLLELCGRASTPADLASELDLPFRVVQILLADLHQYGLVEELSQPQWGDRPDPRVLMRVLDELRRI